MHRRILLSAMGSNSNINLEIEGSLSGITTSSQLANFLGVSVSKIRSFTNTGSLIRASIRGNYPIPATQFNGNTSMTKLRDIGGIIGSIGINGLRNTALTQLVLPRLETTLNAAIGYNMNLLDIDLPNLSSYGNQALRGNSVTKTIKMPQLEKISEGTIATNALQGLASLELLDMKKLKVYGTPAGQNSATNSGFSGLKPGCIINVNIALATANAGTVNTAFLYAKNTLAAIVNFYDDSGNFISTL